GRYEKAIAILSTVSRDGRATKGYRKDALRYLARPYLQRNEPASARDAVRPLLRLDPPMVLLIPTLEPPALMRLYYEVRREKLERDGRSPASIPANVRLAVYHFQVSSDNPEDSPLGRGIADILIDSFNRAGLPVVERADLAIAEPNDSTFYAIEPVYRSGIVPST